MANDNIPDTSWGFKLFGHRSLFSWVFGTFFSNASNTTGILAFVLTVALIALYWKNGNVPEPILTVLLIIVGFYCGGARAGRDASMVPNSTGRELP